MLGDMGTMLSGNSSMTSGFTGYIDKAIELYSILYCLQNRLKQAISFYDTPSEVGILNTELAKYYYVRLIDLSN